MKKTTVAVVTTVGITLFSFQLGASLVHADETTETPGSGIVETLPGEGVPDAGTEISDGGSEIPEQPDKPTQPGTEPGTEPGTTEPELPDPTLPTEPITGDETPGTTPTEPSTTPPEEPGITETPGEKTEPSVPQESTTPTSEQPSDTPKEEPKQSEEKPTEEPTAQPKETQPTAPTKEVMVSVTPTGEITPNASQGTSVPIVTSDVKELTHIPTPTTPLKAASGQTIVGVKGGIPLVQDSQGNLIEDVSIPVKQLPSGNIEVTTTDGETKVLPKTGEEVHVILSILGGVLTSIAGFFGYKKKKNADEVSC